MSDEITGRRIAFLATDGVERVELTEPWSAVTGAGGTPVLVAPHGDTIRSFDHLDPSELFDVHETLDDADAADFAGLVLPGGVANPDQLRTDERAQAFVRDFFSDGKPVAVICHGPWTLIDAGVVDGRTLTSWPSCAPISRTRGRPGLTRRSTWTRALCRAATRTTCPPSARR